MHVKHVLMRGFAFFLTRLKNPCMYICLSLLYKHFCQVTFKIVAAILKV